MYTRRRGPRARRASLTTTRLPVCTRRRTRSLGARHSPCGAWSTQASRLSAALRRARGSPGASRWSGRALGRSSCSGAKTRRMDTSGLCPRSTARRSTCWAATRATASACAHALPPMRSGIAGRWAIRYLRMERRRERLHHGYRRKGVWRAVFGGSAGPPRSCAWDQAVGRAAGQGGSDGTHGATGSDRGSRSVDGLGIRHRARAVGGRPRAAGGPDRRAREDARAGRWRSDARRHAVRRYRAQARRHTRGASRAARGATRYPLDSISPHAGGPR